VSLLLDTHIVLWWLADGPTLADEIKDCLDQELDVYVSSATRRLDLLADRQRRRLKGVVAVHTPARHRALKCRRSSP